MKKNTGYSAAGIIIGIAIVAFIALASFLVIDGNNKATNFNDFDFYSVIEAGPHNGNIADHIKGYDKETGIVTDDPEVAKTAPVVIYEYADFQCSHCASMNERLNSLIEELDGKLAIVYRNYLLSYNQNATAAASAAEAAGLQGYWKPYADKLFKKQAEWQYATGSERTALFDKYFEEVSDGKGDLEKFNTDLASKEVSKKISFDMGIGQRVDISGTPALYIDGQLIDFANENGGSIKIGDETFTWDHVLPMNEFNELIKNIVEAKINSAA